MWQLKFFDGETGIVDEHSVYCVELITHFVI